MEFLLVPPLPLCIPFEYECERALVGLMFILLGRMVDDFNDDDDDDVKLPLFPNLEMTEIGSMPWSKCSTPCISLKSFSPPVAALVPSFEPSFEPLFEVLVMAPPETSFIKSVLSFGQKKL